MQKLGHVAHQLLADALARAVDRQLEGGRGEDHGRGEHGDADGLAEPAVAGRYNPILNWCIKSGVLN
jgi:hypothetical protein